jgi:hypothetical protein
MADQQFMKPEPLPLLSAPEKILRLMSPETSANSLGNPVEITPSPLNDRGFVRPIRETYETPRFPVTPVGTPAKEIAACGVSCG